MVLIGAIDQGTSSSRFLVFESDSGDLICSHQIEVEQLFPNPGWVEMDPMQMINTVNTCVEEVARQLSHKNLSIEDIKCVGIANQRETTVVWDKSTGKPLYNAIVWLDTRTSTMAEESIALTKSKSKDEFKVKTGLPIHPYFSALKLKWLLENVEEVKQAHAKENLLFGTVDTWLIWNLTNEYVTDVTNASRTILLDLHKRTWSTELCNFFQIPIEVLPKIRSSAEVYGRFKQGPLKGVAISGSLGDQQAAMVGHNCLNKGDTKNTYGTGTFMLCNIGSEAIVSKSGLLTTVGFQFGSDAPVVFALEGSGSIGGNVVRFLRDNFHFIKDASEMEPLCRTVKSTEGVVFVPSFTGLYTPYWDPTARGTILGMTQVTNRAHICLAALRAVAFQSSEMISAVENDLNHQIEVRTLKVDGGMVSNGLFNEIQADIIGRRIETPSTTEVSGWGAAVAAAIGAGLMDVQEFTSRTPKNTAYEPQMKETQRQEELSRWKEGIRRASNWAHL